LSPEGALYKIRLGGFYGALYEMCVSRFHCRFHWDEAKKMRYVGFKDYVKEILKTAEYRRDEDLGVVVGVVPALLGCMTQGDNFEETRDLLIDAIELWITVGLREGKKMPSVNSMGSSDLQERA
jgi:predicted RNase H-like HicB family nuclease